MSVSVTVAGVSYTIPSVGDVSWGPQVTAWIQAISSVTLQTTGGAFTLTSDLNFGTSFGLISKYFTSVTAGASGTGVLRLANTDGIGWRNAGNSGDFLLKPDADGILQYNSIDLVNLSATQTLTNKTLTGNTAVNLISGSGTLTLPTSGTMTVPNGTDTLVTLALTQTLTNKTLTSPAISGPTITGVAGIANGLVGAPSLAFTSDPTNGIYRIGTNHWGLTVGGAEAIDLASSTGNLGNVGLGGLASVSDNYPLLILRTLAGTIQTQLSNGDTGAGSGAKLQVFSDAGNNQMEISSFTAATASPDVYAGGRGVVRACGLLAGLTLVADKNSGADVRIYAGGDAIANRMATVNSSGLTLGVAGSLTGQLNLAGVTSGTITLQPQAAAGTYNWNYPITAGTAGYVLTSQGGGSTAMTWTNALTNPMTTGGDIIYGGAAGAAARLANGTSGQVLQSAGGTSAPAWQTLPGNSTALKAPTVQAFTSTGTRAAVMFTVTSANATAGATYTNNSNTYTVLQTIAGSTTLFCSGAGAPLASGTLTKSGGTGDATITFSAKTDLAQYTAPSGPAPIAIRVRGVGAGGGGGSSGTAATVVGTSGKPTVLIPAVTFTSVILSLGGGGGGGNAGGTGGSGGVNAIGASVTVLQVASVNGAGGGGALGAATTQWPGGMGGNSFLGGAGPSVVAGNGNAGTNSGSGGSGGGTGGTASSFPGSGGGAGGYGELLLVGAAIQNMYYAIGTLGAGGTAGTSGNAGGNGADGQLVFEELYQ